MHRATVRVSIDRPYQRTTTAWERLVKLEPLMEYYANLEAPLEVGVASFGNRVIVEVNGGEFEGPRLKGKIRQLSAADKVPRRNSRASSSAFFGPCPKEWLLLGLPKCSRWASAIASTTDGRGRVVAALSR